jgi:hypothetical protein
VGTPAGYPQQYQQAPAPMAPQGFPPGVPTPAPQGYPQPGAPAPQQGGGSLLGGALPPGFGGGR